MDFPFKEIYDISLIFGEESFTYPGDPSFNVEKVSSLENGDDCNISGISMSLHEGTHLDFPSHFFVNGKTCADYKIEKFIMRAKVVEIPDKKTITKDDLKNLDIESSCAILFKTDNSKKEIFFNGKFTGNYCCLDESGADKFLESSTLLIGIDAPSIERYYSSSYPVHKKLLSHGILILEGINLSAVAHGEYTLICMPLKIAKSEASPVRAVLLK